MNTSFVAGILIVAAWSGTAFGPTPSPITSGATGTNNPLAGCEARGMTEYGYLEEVLAAVNALLYNCLHLPINCPDEEIETYRNTIQEILNKKYD